ncbi:alpha-ketoglutarate-dependent dioxygenase AlkB [Dactylosporangium sp. NPDC000521]|uniref:alpha-ketoglutarate-dependent dioxygenase AlkB n=1 Tax=Dactylosporangium sp. NPDC000521 TaxID=3363975 RepID=UPI0036A9D30D
MRPGSEIRSYALPTDGNPFEQLFAAVRFEPVGKGRLGAVLVRPDGTGDVPIVRTTTRYSSPAQRFPPVYERLARQVQARAALPAGFNNALVESYTNTYTTMGGHSDQALDLADGSSIAVFSCYERPDAPPRKLVVESKEHGDEFEIPMPHSSVIVFSVDTNRRHRHRIVLDRPAQPAENRWLGVTFRTSKTFIRYHGGHANLRNGARLTPADDDQRREFYLLRRRENTETDFTYPPLTYTVSAGDLLPPVSVPPR